MFKLAGLVFLVFFGNCVFATISPTIIDNWKKEYQTLENQISARKITEHQGLAKGNGADEGMLAGQVVNQQALIHPSDEGPIDVIVRRTAALIEHLKTLPNVKNIDALEARLYNFIVNRQVGSLSKNSAGTELGDYFELKKIAREVALVNPLLDNVNDLLFVEMDICTNGDKDATIKGDHICDQYYGHNAKPGGGLYILKDFKTNPVLVNVVENSRVQSGPLQGKSLMGGAFLSPDLSYDGKTILFAWSPGTCADKSEWFKNDVGFHIFKVNIDGTDLVQLTEGIYDDFDPCWLPNGRIVFNSTRRGGKGRCHGRAVPTYTLFSMKDDGTDIICLSFHETNEWHPSVGNDGMIVYTRWDYIDRSDCIAHHLWTCYPDGRDPRSSHGNYPLPLTTMTGSNWPNGRNKRPDAELNIRAIPGTGKYVATAGPHHSQAYGSLVIIDPSIEDDGMMSQVSRLTPNEPFAEAESSARGYLHKYGTAWPLSETFYLCNYEHSIALIDKFGGHEILYTTKANDNGITGGTFGFRPIDPIPIQVREAPPIIPTQTYQGERLNASAPNATIYVNDVYSTDEFGSIPDSVTITEMRIIQIFPKMTDRKNRPNISYNSESLTRMALGTVPVEDDGSVYCQAPVNKEIYFQLLDEKGLAIQSMRSGTYLHPGEQMSCVGCHENKWQAPSNTNPKALQNGELSDITPEAGGLEPVNFYRLVKPILDMHCSQCHNDSVSPNMSYASLTPYLFGFSGDVSTLNSPKIGGSRTLPMYFGARASELYSKGYLDSSHYNVNLGKDELRRLTLWLDLNSNEFGAYYDEAKQKAGELVWPQFDVDPGNPMGVEERINPVIPGREKGNIIGLSILKSATTIRLLLPQTGNYIVQITDIQGRVVPFGANNTVSTSGQWMYSIPVSAFKPGLYLVSVKGEGKIFPGKISILP